MAWLIYDQFKTSMEIVNLKPLKINVLESFLLLVVPPPLTVLLLPLQLKILNVNLVLPVLTVQPTDLLIVYLNQHVVINSLSVVPLLSGAYSSVWIQRIPEPPPGSVCHPYPCPLLAWIADVVPEMLLLLKACLCPVAARV